MTPQPKLPISNFKYDPLTNKFIYLPSGARWVRCSVDIAVGPVEGMRATEWLKLHAPTEFRLIRVCSGGPAVWTPVAQSGCPYQADHSSAPSCVNGGSMCDGYWGLVEVEGRAFVQCIGARR